MTKYKSKVSDKKKININNLFSKKPINFLDNELFDVAIIGGGIVGTAIFKKFAEEGAKTVLIEKENDILEGASKGNSAILHTGFDAPEGSLELKCIKDGYEEYLKINNDLNLPVLKTSALVTAWDNDQLEKLNDILKKGINNGIRDLDILNRKEVLEKEPNLSKEVKAALLVRGESIIDPWSTALAYLLSGIQAGGKTAFSCSFESGKFHDEYWHLKTSRVALKAKIVINAAGLYGDVVDSLCGFKDFTIKPRKGQFLVFDKTSFNLINSIILPVPTKFTKGIVITKTVFGNLLVGPTAEEQISRSDSSVEEDTLKHLKREARRIVPAIEDHNVISVFSGIRPATNHSEYQIKFHKSKNWITVGGIRSTGLTAALGIAKYVYNFLEKKHNNPIINNKITVPNISEMKARDFEKPGFTSIVCHCELVTDREIKNAMIGESGAGTLGGLKRRTRVSMGRCQGFNCLASVIKLCQENDTTQKN